MKKIAIYPGSFDPPTNGHLNIIERGLKTFDELIVAVAVNTSKQGLFTPSERIAMLSEIFKDEPKVRLDHFEGLLVDYVRAQHTTTILRGIRTMSDYEYEFQMALANKKMAPEIETIFMMTEGHYSHISSSIIKEIVRFGGKGEGMIHPLVEARMKEKLSLT